MKHTPFYLVTAVLGWSLMAAPAHADLAALVSGVDAAEAIRLAAIPAGTAGALDIPFNSVILLIPDSSLVATVTETVSPMSPAPAPETVLPRAHVPVQIGMLSSAPLSPLSLAALAGVAKPSQGFFLDNPDDPAAGITLSLTTSAPLPIIVMDTPIPTPLPPAVLLFGSGLVGLAATRVRTRLA